MKKIICFETDDELNKQQTDTKNSMLLILKASVVHSLLTEEIFKLIEHVENLLNYNKIKYFQKS